MSINLIGNKVHLGTLHRTQVTGSAGMALLLTFAQDLGLGKEFCDKYKNLLFPSELNSRPWR